ncbi:hypothetical protein [Dokdonia pacifica]|nr:hypothetical protein [Dokdonia pacifica]
MKPLVMIKKMAVYLIIVASLFCSCEQKSEPSSFCNEFNFPIEDLIKETTRDDRKLTIPSPKDLKEGTVKKEI